MFATSFQPNLIHTEYMNIVKHMPSCILHGDFSVTVMNP